MNVVATITPERAADTVWDAAIIGAGVAGSVAAHQIARSGKRVILIDKSHFPRNKICGCCLNGNALRNLERAGLGNVVSQLGAVPLTRLQLASGGRSALLPWPAGVSLSRTAFDVALIQRAIDAGAAFLPGTRAVMGVERDGVREIALENQRIMARVVIAADGLNGRAAAVADGFDVPAKADSRIGAGVVLEYPHPDYARETVYMATSRGGYVGLVRLEDDRLDIAAAFDVEFVRASGSLGVAATRILCEAGLPEIPELAHAAWRGTPALTRTPAKIAGRRWFAIGDAAGYVEPFTGEGMGWAISSAIAVSPFVLKDWHEADIRAWSRVHRLTVSQRQFPCRIISRALRYPSITRFAVRILSIAPQLSAPVLRALHRPATLAQGRSL